MIFTDDQAYQDLACYGSPLTKPARRDRMAAEGMTLTDFYGAAPFCIPSRALLLTGGYAQRGGVAQVRGQRSREGIAASEILLVGGLVHPSGAARISREASREIIVAPLADTPGASHRHMVTETNDRQAG